MREWKKHWPGKLRASGVVDPLCGQTTGWGARGCDQAIVTYEIKKLTCAKCKRLRAKGVKP